MDAICCRFHLLSHPDFGGMAAAAGFGTGVFRTGMSAAGGIIPTLPHSEGAAANGWNFRTGTSIRSGTPGRRVCGRYTALKPPRRRWGMPVLMPRRYTRRNQPIWPLKLQGKWGERIKPQTVTVSIIEIVQFITLPNPDTEPRPAKAPVRWRVPACPAGSWTIAPSNVVAEVC